MTQKFDHSMIRQSTQTILYISTYKSGILWPDHYSVGQVSGVGQPKHEFQQGLGLLGCPEVQIQFFVFRQSAERQSAESLIPLRQSAERQSAE